MKRMFVNKITAIIIASLFPAILCANNLVPKSLFIENQDRSIIKTYTGEHPYYWEGTYYKLTADYCTYQYYDQGYERIYHGSFLLKTNVVNFRNGDAGKLLIIKGAFKDGFREGVWEFRLEDKEEINLWRLTYSGGHRRGKFVRQITAKTGGAARIILSTEGNFNENIVVGSYRSKSVTSTCEATMDEYGYLDGLFKSTRDGERVQVFFDKGKPLRVLIQNMQTGRVYKDVANPPFNPSRQLTMWDWMVENYTYIRDGLYLGDLFLVPLYDIYTQNEGSINIGFIGGMQTEQKNKKTEKELQSQGVKQEVYVPVKVIEEEEDPICHNPDVAPEFPGGTRAVMDYIAKSMQYPDVAKENRTQGRVIVQFVVNVDGSTANVEIVKSVDQHLDKEALRIVQSMPKWKPGKKGGKAVSVRYTVPVMFRLH